MSSACSQTRPPPTMPTLTTLQPVTVPSNFWSRSSRPLITLQLAADPATCRSRSSLQSFLHEHWIHFCRPSHPLTARSRHTNCPCWGNHNGKPHVYDCESLFMSRDVPVLTALPDTIVLDHQRLTVTSWPTTTTRRPALQFLSNKSTQTIFSTPKPTSTYSRLTTDLLYTSVCLQEK